MPCSFAKPQAYTVAPGGKRGWGLGCSPTARFGRPAKTAGPGAGATIAKARVGRGKKVGCGDRGSRVSLWAISWATSRASSLRNDRLVVVVVLAAERIQGGGIFSRQDDGSGVDGGLQGTEAGAGLALGGAGAGGFPRVEAVGPGGRSGVFRPGGRCQECSATPVAATAPAWLSCADSRNARVGYLGAHVIGAEAAGRRAEANPLELSGS